MTKVIRPTRQIEHIEAKETIETEDIYIETVTEEALEVNQAPEAVLEVVRHVKHVRRDTISIVN
jgi:hypothetical protein